MKKRYFDVHVFYSRKDGASYFFETTLPDDYNEEDVISDAVNKKIIDVEDMGYVDYVNEVTEEEYKQAKGIT